MEYVTLCSLSFIIKPGVFLGSCTFYYIENINKHGLLVGVGFVVNKGKSELNSCNSSVKKSLRCVTKLNYAFIFMHFA